MIDIHKIRENPKATAKKISSRGKCPLLNPLFDLDQKRREQIAGLEEKRRRINDFSKQVGVRKKNGEDASDLMESVRLIKEEVSGLNNELHDLEEKIDYHMLRIPNIPADEVPIGIDESSNKELFVWGDIPSFDFEVKAHDELGKDLGILSSELGVQLAKTRFTLLRGAAARLERALINFMLDEHNKNGYEEVLPPFICNAKTMTGTGQLPKFEEDLFKIEKEDLYLIPTAEVPLTNVVADSVLKDLKPGSPIKLMAYTPCFRSEAGSYGKDTKGYLRQHQFNKVELVKITHPDDSIEEHEKLTQDAEGILQALKIPYRKVDLCTGDLGFSAARTYDLEIWLPSQKQYRETSSCSNFFDFQARRAGIRFKDPETKKNLIAHTINGSGLAVGRTLIAIFENFQTSDGDVIIPEVLRPYMRGQKTLKEQLK